MSIAGTRAGELSATAIRRSINRHVLVGLAGAVVLLAALGASASLVDLAGAIVAPGRLVVASSVKQVQTSVAGTVRQINVSDGDHVAAGDLLVGLDATTASADVAAVTHAIDAIRVQQARLQAEATGAPNVKFPPDIMARSSDADLSSLMAVASAEFASRRSARESQKNQLGKKVAELQQQLAGVGAQQDAVKQQLSLTQNELDSYKTLQSEGLMGNTEVSNVERLVAQYSGQVGELAGAAGQVGSEIAETNLQIEQVDADMQSQVAHDLNDDEAKLAELTQHEIAAREMLGQFEIRAPQSGTVYQLAIHTIGGVVAPGQTLMLIVPSNDVLEVEARIDPGRVDQVNPGSEARLRFVTLGARTTPEFVARVESVSPDSIVDERSGISYFTARIGLPHEATAALGKALVPGLPVEVYVSTGDRSALSYLVRPLTDQFARMFRER
jgi:HlyD family secretion protein